MDFLDKVIAGLSDAQLNELIEETKAGDAQSHVRLALQYLSLSPPSEAAAICLLRKAAYSDYILAQSWLGFILCTSRDFRDYREGNKWLLVAAMADDRNAQLNLGVNFLFGRGFDRDISRAGVWFHLAAIADNPSALERLGAMYALGERVSKNWQLGEDLLLMAAELGDHEAKKYLKGEICQTPQIG